MCNKDVEDLRSFMVCTPLSTWEGGGGESWASYQIFKKWGGGLKPPVVSDFSENVSLQIFQNIYDESRETDCICLGKKNFMEGNGWEMKIYLVNYTIIALNVLSKLIN